MLKLKYVFIFGFLVLILAAAFQGYGYYYQKIFSRPLNDPLYENPGYCSKDTNTSLCMGSKDIYFLQILRKQQTSYKYKAEQVTKWLGQRNKIYNTVEVKYVNNSYQMLAKINLVKNSIIFKFQTNEMLLSNMINSEFFTENMNLKVLENDISLIEKLQLSPVNTGTISLLYHMYHYKESKLQPWMMTFPQKLPNLVKDITMYELNLIENDITSSQILHFISNVQRDFIQLAKEMDQKWNKTERNVFFKYHDYKLDDYFYARMVLHQSGLTYPPKDFILLSPSTLYIHSTPCPKQLNEFSYLHTELEENKTIIHTIKIDREVKKGDTVEVEWEDSGEWGLILRGNGHWERYCIKMPVINWENSTNSQQLLVLYANQGQKRICLKYSDNHQQLIQILNYFQDYNEEEMSKCLFDIEQIKKKFQDEEQQFESIELQDMLKIIEETCKKPKEKFGKGFEYFLNQLEETRSVYLAKITEAQNYLLLRQKKKNRDENAKLILQLLNDKVLLINKLKERIEEDLIQLKK